MLGMAGSKARVGISVDGPRACGCTMQEQGVQGTHTHTRRVIVLLGLSFPEVGADGEGPFEGEKTQVFHPLDPWEGPAHLSLVHPSFPRFSSSSFSQQSPDLLLGESSMVSVSM